ncbi:alpha/beta hydrolase [Agromyces soli]
MPKVPATVAARIAAARAAERRSPELAARLVLPVFRSTRPMRRVSPHERGIHETARRFAFTAGGRPLVGYEWGHGADVVVLVHGWRGRASQFAPIVRELRAEGFRLVAFDAPAHGDSAGRRADIRDWIAAIEALQQRYGRFRSIVGHSLGASATLAAVHEGVSTDGVVAIASVADARYTTDAFSSALGLGPATAAALGSAFARQVMPEVDEAVAWRRFDRAADPLPVGVPLLLVHDTADREVAASESERLLASHGDRARYVPVSGSGHSRVLGHDTTLDAVTAFAATGLEGVDALGVAREASVV